MTIPLPKLTALHALFEHGARFKDHPMCHDGQRLVHWSEFVALVSARVGVLRQRHETRWLLANDDPLAFIVGLLALLYAGKQVLIPPNTQPGTLAALADSFEARFDERDSVFAVDASSAPHALMSIDPNTSTIDLYTSGSTGAYKRVRKTLVQLEAEVAVLESMWGETLGTAVVLATAPHQHIYGLLFRLLWPLASGRIFDAVTCVRPDLLEERLTFFGNSALISSPAQLTRLPELLSLDSIKPKLVTVFSSGGPLPANAARALSDGLGQSPIEIFGSTETGGVAWRQQDSAASDLWTPFPGHLVNRSESGALILNSPFLPNERALEMDDGIELMADGRFRLLGRLDRVVKIEEKRLSLPEMEARLLAHDWVEAAAVVALSGRRQSIGAALILSAAGKASLDAEGKRSVTQALHKHLAGHFEAVLLPRHWRFIDRLPTTDRGKIAYAALVALFSPANVQPLLPEVINVASDKSSSLHQVILDLHVVPEIAHFAGHFPGAALLPGVVQVDWAVHFARQYLPLEGVFSALENLKFLGVIVPDTKLQLSLAWDAERKRLDFSYATSDRKYSVGRIVFSGAQ